MKKLLVVIAVVAMFVVSCTSSSDVNVTTDSVAVDSAQAVTLPDTFFIKVDTSVVVKK